VERVRVARAAEFLDFHPVGMHLFILGGAVVPLLAVRAGQRYFRSQLIHPVLYEVARISARKF